MEARGKTLLKVTGIIMIVGGALGLALNLISGIGILDMFGYSGYNMLFIALGLGVLCGLLELITGILGVANCGKPEKANLCIVFAFITLAISIACQVLSWMSAADTGMQMGVTSYISFGLSLILPILYLIGAFRNRAVVRR